MTRELFFKKLLTNLAHAASGGYDELYRACKEIQARIDKSYPTLPLLNIKQQQSNLEGLSIDHYSKSFLPDSWRHVCPVSCDGDGNCLYRYAQLSC